MQTHPLRTFRKARELTEEQLASLLGVSRATVNAIENGRRRVTPENAKAWAPVTGLSKAELCPEVFDEAA